MLVYRIILQQIKLSSRAIAIIGLLMSIVGCALIGDWQAISFDECTYFSPYHNPTLHINETVYTQLETLNELSVNRRDYNAYTKKITCSMISGQEGCGRTHNECLLIQYSPGIEFNIYNYPCDSIINDKRVKTYSCQWNQTRTICLHINETGDQAGIQSFAVNSHLLMTQHQYRNAMKQCTEADVRDDHCYWIPNSPITNHYCRDCQPICRGFSKSLNFAQFCIGAAMLMLSIPIAWVPVAAMASERTTKEMQVRICCTHCYVFIIMVKQKLT